MKKFLSFFISVSMLFTLSSPLAYAEQSIFDTSDSSLFSNDEDFLSVDQAFTFNFHQQGKQLKITFDIEEGYYLYRHQFKFTDNNAVITPIDLPTGIEHEDEFFGIQEIYKDQLVINVDIVQAEKNSVLTVRYQGCADKGLCYPPIKKVISLERVIKSLQTTSDNETNQSVLSAITATDSAASTPSVASNVNSSEQNQLADMLKQDSLLLTLVAFFVGGLLLSFTPCVFPMYPILTGIIVGQAKDKVLTTKRAFTLSFFYVQGMAVTYTILGIVVALAGAQFQAIFQHPIVLIGLSILFIFLALSMFGIFNLALPSSWQNKLNNLSNNQKGGSIAGVVMMGVISGLVASPCTTAPLTGALLYISQTGDVVLGASALYALSLGMGLPLLVLGSSGGKILPKAGAWMNIIKNVFGLLLLAVPVFLLERIIPEVATEALWALLILASASYFYVSNQNSAQGKEKGFWYGVRALVIFLALFIGANMAYQLIAPSQVATSEHKNSDHDFIHVSSLSELNEAVLEANNDGKTVMVDLYADWCIACKEFEKYTFNQPQVQAALAKSVLIQIDLTETTSTTSIELMDHYQVLGLPSILFFNLEGDELTNNRVTGFMKADEFTAHVNSIFN